MPRERRVICRHLAGMTKKIHMEGEEDSAKKVREQMKRGGK